MKKTFACLMVALLTLCSLLVTFQTNALAEVTQSTTNQADLTAIIAKHTIHAPKKYNGNDLQSGKGHANKTNHTTTNTQSGTTSGDGNGPLDYNGGNVMHTNHIHLIFWNPGTLQDGSSTTVASSYYTLIPQFLADLSGSSIYNVLTQYYDNTNGHIQNSVQFLINNSPTEIDWVTDTSSYPGSSSSPECVGTGWSPRSSVDCVTNNDIQTEIANVASYMGTNYSDWTQAGTSNSYIVITANGESSCAPGIGCSYVSYCGYHNYFVPSGIAQPTYYYESIPYQNSSNTLSTSYFDTCKSGSYPNDSLDTDADGADSVVNTISHETAETVTDPHLDAWKSTSTDEIGDICAYDFGNNLTSGNTAADIQIGSDYYYIQREWSNIFTGSNNSTMTYAGCGMTLSNTINGEIFQTKIVQTGYYPNQTTTGSIVATNAANGSNIWSSDSVQGGYKTVLTNSHTLYQSDPVVDPVNGLLYTEAWDANLAHGDLIAVNAHDGTVEHDFSLTNVQWATQPVIDHNANIYIFGTDNKIYCYQKDTNTPLWSYATTNSGSGGSVEFTIDSNRNVLYYPSDDGYLYGLNDQLATSPHTLYISYNPNGAGYGKIAMNYQPSLDGNGNVYFGSRQTSYPNNSYALSYNPASTSLNWHESVGGQVYNTVESSTASYITTSNGLYVFNISNGGNTWTSEAIGSPYEATLGSSLVFFNGYRNSLLAYGQTSGTQSWSSSTWYGYPDDVTSSYNGSSYTDTLLTEKGYALNSDGTTHFTWTSPGTRVVFSAQSF